MYKNTPTITFDLMQRFVDDRGTFNNYNCPFIPKRVYTCYNHGKGIVRGYHFHNLEEKFFVCLIGSIKFTTAKLVDGILTNIEICVLSAETTKTLYIPAGYGNAWQTLQDGTMLLGMSSLSIEESVKDDYRIDPLKTPEIWQTVWR